MFVSWFSSGGFTLAFSVDTLVALAGDLETCIFLGMLSLLVTLRVGTEV